MRKFENIKLGDKVVIRIVRFGNEREVITTVVKVTETQFTVFNGDRYFKDNGDKFGERGKMLGTYSIADRIAE